MSKDKDDKKTRRLVRIDPKKVEAALKDQIVVAAAHLDFEGVAYIKLTRTGAQDCFAADVTSNILGGGENSGRYKDQQHMWKRPAMEKFGDDVGK